MFATRQEAVEALKQEMDSILQRVYDCVGDHDTIPKDKVFPQFLKLGYLQQKLVELHRMLVMTHRLVEVVTDSFNTSRASIPQVR